MFKEGRQMPEISRFYGIAITMNFRDIIHLTFMQLTKTMKYL